MRVTLFSDNVIVMVCPYQVWEKLKNLVQDEEALAWLKEATAPVVRR